MELVGAHDAADLLAHAFRHQSSRCYECDYVKSPVCTELSARSNRIRRPSDVISDFVRSWPTGERWPPTEPVWERHVVVSRHGSFHSSCRDYYWSLFSQPVVWPISVRRVPSPTPAAQKRIRTAVARQPDVRIPAGRSVRFEARVRPDRGAKLGPPRFSDLRRRPNRLRRPRPCVPHSSAHPWFQFRPSWSSHRSALYRSSTVRGSFDPFFDRGNTTLLRCRCAEWLTRTHLQIGERR